MKKLILVILTVLLTVLLLSGACADENRWFCNTCRIYRTTRFCPDCGAGNPFPGKIHGDVCYSNVPYDIGVPDLHRKSFTLNQMNIIVYWVQTQLKATGIYYQGEQWDVTGNLGDHTMQEISYFMRDRGYRNHDGRIDQTVINELARFLDYRLIPVYAGGFYRYMDTLLSNDHIGSMEPIVSNLRDMVPHVTERARWIQYCLKKLRYYEGPVDGMYGEETEKAVKAFQKDNCFQQRDYVSLGVARAMLEQYCRVGFDPRELP